MEYIPISLGIPIPLGILVVGNMVEELSNESIKLLFKELDEVDFQILYLFRQGKGTRYQILIRSKPVGGKNPSIPRSTLYRKINEKLIPLGFLEEVAREKFEKGNLKQDNPILALTVFKGIFASTTHKPDSIPNYLKGWYRWLHQFNMDLSRVKVDPKFFLWTSIFAVADHPEWFPEELRTIGKNLQKNLEKCNQKMMEIYRKTIFGNDDKKEE